MKVLVYISLTGLVRTMSIGQLSHDQHSQILEPLHDTAPLAHGGILSPERLTLKLDCPTCPPFDPSWKSDSTSLIFDFTIPSDVAHPSHEPFSLLLNDKDVGHKPFDQEKDPLTTTASAILIPADTPLLTYLQHPEYHSESTLETKLQPCSVSHTQDWDISCLLITPVSLDHPIPDSEEHQTFTHQINDGGVPTIQLFLRKQPSSAVKSDDVSLDANDLGKEEEVKFIYSLEYWRLLPSSLLNDAGEGKKLGLLDEDGSFTLPKGLEDKILGRHPRASAAVRSAYWKHTLGMDVGRIGPWNALQIWTLAAVVVGMVLGAAWVVGKVGRALVRRVGGRKEREGMGWGGEKRYGILKI